MADGPGPGPSEASVPFPEWLRTEIGFEGPVDPQRVGDHIERQLGEPAAEAYWEQVDLDEGDERNIAWGVGIAATVADPKFYEALEASGSVEVEEDDDPSGAEARAALEEFASNPDRWLGY